MRRSLSFLTAALCAGCFFPADRGRVLEERVDALSSENQKLLSELKDTRKSLEETTAQLQAALDQLDRASRTTGANMGVKVDTALQDIAVLRGQLEAQQYKVQELEGKLAAAPAPGPTAAAPEPKKEELKRPEDPKDFLALAQDKAKAGEADLARRLFTEYLRKFPRDPNLGEAHFGLGALHVADQKCREALYEFGKVIQEYAKTPSAPKAYLHSADCFRQLKMNDEARLALEELVKSHPKSEEARTARTRLAELRKGKK
jgi:tol-pal system protein YbgF